jgi:PTH1 family peptidyl-tRNA hydrolase
VTGRPPVPEGVERAEAGGAEPSQPRETVVIRPLVVCDDLSLPLGSVRLRPSGSSGGQNGLASVIDHLGGEEFPRLRLGIAPLAGNLDPEAWSEHVLADFEEGERPVAAELVAHAADALEFWLDHALEPAISRFNRRVRIEPESPG